MAQISGNLMKRSDKVAFYGIKAAEGDTYTYHRMQGFTDISTSKNPIEYSRQYVDEEFEQSDVVGYSPSISYGFDQFAGNEVHEDIVKISDDELLGTEAVRPIVMVDMSKAGTPEGSFAAVKRDFAVIPDSEGDSTDAYTYSGNLKVKGDKIKGTATSADGWQTITFTEEGAEA